ncbi:hypothetical protein PICSAR10_04516 [Mycobacterium avium subsp. paratuberculosis]|nr:hypothetical protein PICSAR10_04516 [Mycobacterium avium subsp. paratuberculosis]
MPKILLTIDASTSSAATRTARPAPTPMSTLRRRRAKVAGSFPGEMSAVDGEGESSIGPSTSVRSATAVAC